MKIKINLKVEDSVVEDIAKQLKIKKETAAKLFAQDLIERYFSIEYFDIERLKS